MLHVYLFSYLIPDLPTSCFIICILISVSEALENSDVLGTSASSSSSHSDTSGLGLSSLFDTGDKVLTQTLIQSASGYIADGLKSLGETITGKSRRRR